jgi:tripartite-type tricarboxylate transporter receptor subunit TctC
MSITPIGSKRAAYLMSLTSALCVMSSLSYGQTAEEFYRGKNMDFIIGFSVGGGYDLYARTVARFIGDHIPGKPKVVPKNMIGAGSRVAAAYVYGVAPKDGLTLATADQSIPLEQSLGDKGISFDARQFTWIGNPIVDNNVIATWYTAGVKTIDDARQREVTMGATGYNTSAQYPQVSNSLLGTKFKIIMGYPGGAEVNLAMENGEVAGRGSNSWASYKATKPEWVRDHKLDILFQIGLKKASDLQDVPLLMDLGTNEEDRAALKLVSAPPSIGRPVFSTPNVPQERTKALRAAFDEMVKDPAFLADAKTLNLDIDPISGEELQRIVEDIINAPAGAKARLSSVLDLLERPR